MPSCARLLEAIGIALLVAKLQRIGGDFGAATVSNLPSSKKDFSRASAAIRM